MPALSARRVGVRRGGRWLVEGVDLDVQSGTFVALVGPNGAGKSTLMRALAGDLGCDVGSVALQGCSLAEWTPRQLARRRAVLPQHSELVFRFSALEVVRMGRLPFDEPAAHTDRIAREALAEVGLAGLTHRDWTTLSGGERQRVQLARVLAQIHGVDDGVLFLDEPTNHLDLTHQLHVLERARTRVSEGLTVVAVLHDLSFAARMADAAVVMADGRVVAAGSPAATLTPEVLERVFGVRLRRVPVDGGFVLIPRS